MNSCHGIIPENFRDAILASVKGKLDPKDAPKRFDVPSRSLRTAIKQLELINKIREESEQKPLSDERDRRQIFRWANKYTNAKAKEREAYTQFELTECIFNIVTSKMKNKAAFEEYGIAKSTFTRYITKVCAKLNASTLKDLRVKYKLNYTTDASIRRALQSIELIKKGNPTILLPDEESLLVATAEMKCYASNPQQAKRLAHQANSLIKELSNAGVCQAKTDIKPQSRLQYFRRMLQRVIKREPDAKNVVPTKRQKTGEVKVGGLSNVRAKQADPRLSWYMFHSICDMYRTNKKECDETMNDMLIETGVCEEIATTILGPKATRTIDVPEVTPTKEDANVNGGKVYKRHDITEEDCKKSLQELTVIPSDFADIQPRADQVWNCDEIGIDPNGNWNRVVCTRIWCELDQIWRTVEGEHAPFWVTLLFYTRADGQCFVPPTIVHQACEWTADLGIGVPDNWVVHSTPSGYMDRDGFIKTCDNFARLSGSSATNHQFSFFDGHDSHWAPEALDLLAKQNVSSFFLKSGDSVRDQPNDNGPNCSLRACYNDCKDEWDEMFGTTKFNPPHFNAVMGKAWGRFTMKAAPIIRAAFQKTGIYPLRPPCQMKDADTLAGACTAAMQCAKGKKAIELDLITKKAVHAIEYTQKQSTNPWTIIKAKSSDSRNLLIRTVAYDFMKTSLLLPSQEIKRVQQEHANARKVKVGTMALPKNSRTNPDTSRGLFVNGAVRAKARMVQSLKDKKEEEDKHKKEVNQKKMVDVKRKREEAFTNVLTMLQASEAPIADVLGTLTTDKLRLVYQHLGGAVSKLPNNRNDTFVTVLAQRKELSRPAPSTIPPMPELPTAPATNCESRTLGKHDMVVVEALNALFTSEVDKKVDEDAGDSFQTMEM